MTSFKIIELEEQKKIIQAVAIFFIIKSGKKR
jgi:hypothetical protein